jgi:hypothetical protein
MQKLIRNENSSDITIFSSFYFNPLGAEVSSHWFRNGTDTLPDDMILGNTRMVHWYNSAERRVLKTKVDRPWFQHPHTPFAEMVRRYAAK